MPVFVTVEPPPAVTVTSNENVTCRGDGHAAPRDRAAANEQAGSSCPANDVPVGTTSLTLPVNAAPGLLTDRVYVSVSPGAASVAETDLTISGRTSSLFVTVLLGTGLVWSESTVAVFEIV